MNALSKREYLRQKYKNFQTFLLSSSTVDQYILEGTEDVRAFSEMTEEQLIVFAITKLKPYKDDLSYPCTKIMEVFKIRDEKATRFMIINYLELLLSLVE